MEREKLSSRLGFILLSAGCAIGIGNVWKFPYMAGMYGGAVFIVFYLFFLVILGIPVMTMEFAMGRAAGKSIAGLYQKLEPAGSRWHLHSWLAAAGNYLLMMFYTTVAGWMLKYFVDMTMGSFDQASADVISSHFSSMLGSPGIQILYMGIVVAAGFGICALGLVKGLENVTKYMMIALLLIMGVLAVNSIFLEGADEGLRYFLLPDWNRFMEIGPWKVIAAAMNQAFFTLSLGIGAMAVFGSYIDKDRTLMGESVNIALLDTFVAIVSGLIIIPACFAFHVQVDSGPSLIFLTLPNIFAAMPMGRFWGACFFLFMSFAAFSTVLAVFENILSITMDLTGISRTRACLYNGIAVFLLSIPCVLGFNVLSSVSLVGEGSTILDLEDAVVSGFLLPFGAFVMVVFCTWKFGWGWKAFRKEANSGRGLRVPDWLHPYCKYVLPLIIVLIFAAGLLQ